MIREYSLAYDLHRCSMRLDGGERYSHIFHQPATLSWDLVTRYEYVLGTSRRWYVDTVIQKPTTTVKSSFIKRETNLTWYMIAFSMNKQALVNTFGENCQTVSEKKIYYDKVLFPCSYNNFPCEPKFCFVICKKKVNVVVSKVQSRENNAIR